jgi:hypothetical protein
MALAAFSIIIDIYHIHCIVGESGKFVLKKSSGHLMRLWKPLSSILSDPFPFESSLGAARALVERSATLLADLLTVPVPRGGHYGLSPICCQRFGNSAG